MTRPIPTHLSSSFTDPPVDTTPLQSSSHQDSESSSPQPFISSSSPPDTPSLKNPRSQVPSPDKRYNWIFELLCLFTSAVAIIASVIVLRVFHDRPVPPWSLGTAGLSLNSILSLLSTFSRASLLIPLDEALGQLMWLALADQSGRGRKLVEAELYNQASRGPWGALKLLIRRRGRGVACLGAGLMWMAVGLGTAQQQLLAYPTKQTLIFSPSSVSVSCAPKTYDTYQLIAPTDPTSASAPSPDGKNTPMVSFAVSASLFSSLTPHQKGPVPAYACPQGNCEYPSFTSLAICSHCNDAEVLQANCPNDDGIDGDASVCHASHSGSELSATVWKPGSSHTAHTSSTILNQTANAGSKNNILTLNTLTASTENNTWPPRFVATKCEILWCAREVSAQVENSTYYESFRVLSTTPEMQQDSTATFSTPANHSTNSSAAVFHVSPTSQKAFKALSLNLEGWSRRGPNNIWTHSSALFAGLSLASSQAAAADAMANGLSVAIRSEVAAIKGSKVETNAIVVVRWLWLIYPVAMWLASAVFLGVTVVKSRRRENEVGFWGASVLAAMMWAPACGGGRGGGGVRTGQGEKDGGFGGGDEIRRTVMEGGAGWNAIGMEKRAEGVRVRLVRRSEEDGGEGGWRLVKVGIGADEV